MPKGNLIKVDRPIIPSAPRAQLAFVWASDAAGEVMLLISSMLIAEITSIMCGVVWSSLSKHKSPSSITGELMSAMSAGT